MSTRGMRAAAVVAGPLAALTLGAAPASAGENGMQRFSYADCVEFAEEDVTY